MKMVGLTALAALVGGGFYVHGPIGAGEVYPLPAAEALSRVEGVQLPGRVEGMLYEAAGTPGAVERSVVPGKSVIFTFKANGKPVGTYTVTVDPVDATSSRIDTDFEMAADADENMKGMMMPMANQFRFIGKSLVTESVDAALDGRPFNTDVEKVARMEYVSAYPGEIMKGANDTMNKAAAEMKDMQGTRSTYNHGGGQQPSFVPGQPMVHPNPR